MNVVFPAPRSPVSETRSPAERTEPRASPTARVSSAVAVASRIGSAMALSEQSELLLGHGRLGDRLVEHLSDEPEVRAQGAHLRAGLPPSMQDGRGVEGGDHRAAVHLEPL